MSRTMSNPAQQARRTSRQRTRAERAFTRHQARLNDLLDRLEAEADGREDIDETDADSWSVKTQPMFAMPGRVRARKSVRVSKNR